MISTSIKINNSYRQSSYRSIKLLPIALIMSLASFSGVLRIPLFFYIIGIVIYFLFFVTPFLNRISIGYKTLLLFLLICLLSIIINHPASYFRVWERFAVFLLILLSFSPLIGNYKIYIYRYEFCTNLLKIMTLFSVISFVGYFFGINFFVYQGIELDMNDVGHFSGFMNHSMVLGPISALSCVYCISKVMTYITTNRKQSIYWGTCALACLGSVFLSASRGATAGALFAILLMLLRYYSGKIGKVLKSTIIIAILLAISSTFWLPIAAPIILKNTSNQERGGVFYSREAKMAARIYEIQNNTLTGVGFSTIDESVDVVDREKGTIEPNSSWLGVFSMTGIFGFLTFLFMVIITFITAFKRIASKNLSALMTGLISFFTLHMVTEGYVLAGGSILCGFFWLTMGVTYGLSHYNKINNLV